MTAPIIRLQPLNNGLVFQLEQPVGNDDSVNLFTCALDAAPFPEIDVGRARDGLMAEAGDLLWNGLQDNERVKTALASLLDANEESCVYLRMSGGHAEHYPWEVLRSPTRQFLALERWPVARLTNEAPGGSLDASFDPPLRLVVILGAARIAALPEWTSIYAALESSSLSPDVTVFVCEKAVHDAILQLKRSHIRVEWIKDKPTLKSALREAHLVHVFCHGIGASGLGKPFLQVSTFPSWFTDEEHVILETNDLLPELKTTWLVTLNCCDGADGSDGANSFAFSLVGGGVPAVVAMRRPITVDDSTIFSNAHYRAVLKALTEAVEHGSPLEWAHTLTESRRRLCDDRDNLPPSAAAEKFTQWSLPVLYLRAEEFNVKKTQAGPDPKLSVVDVAFLRGKLDALRSARENMRTDVPPDKLAKIDDAISNVMDQLYAGLGAGPNVQ
jgi:hypothetical protein